MNNKTGLSGSKNFQNFSSSLADYVDLAEETGVYSLWEWDIAADRIYITKKTAEVLGIDADFISSREFEELLNPGSADTVKNTIKTALRKNENFNLKIKVLLPDNTNRWINLWGKPVIEGQAAVKVTGILSDMTELKQRTMELNESALRAKRTQAIAHLGSWEYIASDGSLIWSDETYRIFGKNPESFNPTYENFQENIHPEDREMVSRAFEKSIENKEYGYEVKHRIIHDITGHVRWVQEKCFHSWNRDEELIGSSGMVMDITDKELLTRKYASFYQAIENASNAVIITDSKGRITYSNPAFEMLYGYSFSEIEGQNPRILNPGTLTYFDYGYKEAEYQRIFTEMWEDINNGEKGFWMGSC